MAEVNDLVEKMIKSNNAKGGLVVNKEGTLIYYNEVENPKSIGAIIAFTYGAAESIGESLNIGEPVSILVSLQDSNLIIITKNHSYIGFIISKEQSVINTINKINELSNK